MKCTMTVWSVTKNLVDDNWIPYFEKNKSYWVLIPTINYWTYDHFSFLGKPKQLVVTGVGQFFLKSLFCSVVSFLANII